MDKISYVPFAVSVPNTGDNSVVSIAVIVMAAVVVVAAVLLLTSRKKKK